MKVGMVGLGKLGFPVALALEDAGHEVFGWDISPNRRAAIESRSVNERDHEPWMAELLDESKIWLTEDFDEERPDIILIAVQTPHQPMFEGTKPLGDFLPADFNYTYVKWALAGIAKQIRDSRAKVDEVYAQAKAGKPQPVVEAFEWDPLVVLISTCMPGTFEREFSQHLQGIRFAYHPLFIAMGSVIPDFREPEFKLVGVAGMRVPPELFVLYEKLPLTHHKTWEVMSITSAELTKVAYNAFIGYKLMLANGLAMVADATGADVDFVMQALGHGTDRLISTKYLSAGMGDGGGCHPRDQIAMSWMASAHGIPHDPFRVVIDHREAHAKWLADYWKRCTPEGMERIMLGTAYKPDTNLQTGSHAILLSHYAKPHTSWDSMPEEFDELDEVMVEADWPQASYFFATPHKFFREAIKRNKIPPGSVLVDPWGIFVRIPGVTVVRPGRAW